MKKAFKVKFKIPKEDSLTISKSFISFLNEKGKLVFFSALKKDGYWEGKSTILGNFLVTKDSNAPEINAINFKESQ